MKLKTYCLSCREHTTNMAQEDSKGSQKKKSKKKPNKKVVIEYYKTNMQTYCLVCKKYRE